MPAQSFGFQEDIGMDLPVKWGLEEAKSQFPGSRSLQHIGIRILLAALTHLTMETNGRRTKGGSPSSPAIQGATFGGMTLDPGILRMIRQRMVTFRARVMVLYASHMVGSKHAHIQPRQ